MPGRSSSTFTVAVHYHSGSSGSSSLSDGGVLAESLYLRFCVLMSSFSKSFRSDLKIFLGDSPVSSAISWRVSSLPPLRAATTSSSVLFSFILDSTPRSQTAFSRFIVLFCYALLGLFNFAVGCCEQKLQLPSARTKLTLQTGFEGEVKKKHRSAFANNLP